MPNFEDGDLLIIKQNFPQLQPKPTQGLVEPVGIFREVIRITKIFALPVVITRGCCGRVLLLILLFPLVGVIRVLVFLQALIVVVRRIPFINVRHTGAGVVVLRIVLTGAIRVASMMPRVECPWEGRGRADVEYLKALGAQADIAKPDFGSQCDNIGDLLHHLPRLVARGGEVGNTGDVEGSKLVHVGETLEEQVLELVSRWSLGILAEPSKLTQSI